MYEGLHIVKASDDAQILKATRIYVDAQAHGHAGKYKLELWKRSGNWAMVSVLPMENIEGAAVILKKEGGKWVGKDIGTDLSEWESKAPGLFK